MKRCVNSPISISNKKSTSSHLPFIDVNTPQVKLSLMTSKTATLEQTGQILPLQTQYRRLEEFMESDRLNIVLDEGPVTHVTVVDSKGNRTARASFSTDELYPNTILLTHIEVEGAHQKKGLGSKLMRMLKHECWPNCGFVRVNNAAPAAANFYKRLGLNIRDEKNNSARGERWWRPLPAAGGNGAVMDEGEEEVEEVQWPVVEVEDTGVGERSQKLRIEEAENARRRMEDAEAKAILAQLARTSRIASSQGEAGLGPQDAYEKKATTVGRGGGAGVVLKITAGPNKGEEYRGQWQELPASPSSSSLLAFSSASSSAFSGCQGGSGGGSGGEKEEEQGEEEEETEEASLKYTTLQSLGWKHCSGGGEDDDDDDDFYDDDDDGVEITEKRFGGRPPPPPPAPPPAPHLLWQFLRCSVTDIHDWVYLRPGLSAKEWKKDSKGPRLLKENEHWFKHQSEAIIFAKKWGVGRKAAAAAAAAGGGGVRTGSIAERPPTTNPGGDSRQSSSSSSPASSSATTTVAGLTAAGAGRPHGQGSLVLANGHFYTGGFAEGVFEGTGRLVKPKVWEYRGSFRAGEMHGIGVFHRRSFGLYSPTLLALTMNEGRPDPTVDATAIFSAGDGNTLACLVQQHSQDNAPIIVSEAEGGDGSTAAAAADSAATSAWLARAPNPLVAYKSVGRFEGPDFGSLVLGSLEPLDEVSTVIAEGWASLPTSNNNTTTTATAAAPPFGFGPAGGGGGGGGAAESDSGSSGGGNEEGGGVALAVAPGGRAQDAATAAAALKTYQAMLKAKLALKRSAYEASLNRVARVTSSTSDDLALLKEHNDPLTSPWASLDPCLRSWGFTYKPAPSSALHSWEWPLTPKSGLKSWPTELQASIKWYAKDAGRFPSSSLPGPSGERDDSSLELRQHLVDFPSLWGLVLQGPADDASPQENTRQWIETYRAAKSGGTP